MRLCNGGRLAQGTDGRGGGNHRQRRQRSRPGVLRIGASRVAVHAAMRSGGIVSVVLVLIVMLMPGFAGRRVRVAYDERQTRVDLREHETRRHERSSEQQRENEQRCPSGIPSFSHRSHRRAGPRTIRAILDRSPPVPPLQLKRGISAPVKTHGLGRIHMIAALKRHILYFL
jgi:hypothetical protein